MLTGDTSDGSFVDQLSVHVIGGDSGNGLDFGIVHNNSVALDMAKALALAHHIGVKILY